jgi:HAD domain family 1 in Swiss Army Knife RNA repair proteins
MARHALPEDLEAALRLEGKAGPINAFHVFDFDSTLVRTPTPEEGALAYLEATGEAWPRKGWWGHADSLGEAVLPTPLPVARIIRTVFDELEEVMLRSQTSAAVVVTGRLSKLRAPVLRVLDDAATVHSGEPFIHSSAVFTNPGGLATMAFKTLLMKRLLSEGPPELRNVKELHIWEDRQEHATHFATVFAEELRRERLIETTVHFVPADMP